MTLPGPPSGEIRRLLELCLAEDLAMAGDATTDTIFGADDMARGRIVARDAGRIAGLTMGLQVFAMLDPRVETTILIGDGGDAAAGDVVAELTGPATRDAVALVAGSGARIVDTRKTTPGLRAFEKYAVRCGGGSNHRFGLHDAVMIKDNHIAAAGSIQAAVAAVKAGVGHMVKIEVEVDRRDQIAEALRAGADVILLDNMTPQELAETVALVDGAALTEASGGIAPETVEAVAASGVDIISMGALTHSAPRLDVAMDM